MFQCSLFIVGPPSRPSVFSPFWGIQVSLLFPALFQSRTMPLLQWPVGQPRLTTALGFSSEILEYIVKIHTIPKLAAISLSLFLSYLYRCSLSTTLLGKPLPLGQNPRVSTLLLSCFFPLLSPKWDCRLPQGSLLLPSYASPICCCSAGLHLESGTAYPA